MIRRRQRGAAAIEFVLWMPILGLLLSGLIDLGWYMSNYHRVQRVAMDSVRYGIRFGASEGSVTQGSIQRAQAEARAATLLSGFGLSGSRTATFQQNDGSCPFDRLQLTVTVPFTPLVGMIAMPTSIQSRFVMSAEIQK